MSEGHPDIKKYCTISPAYFLGENGWPSQLNTCANENRKELWAANEEAELMVLQNKISELEGLAPDTAEYRDNEMAQKKTIGN